MTTARLIIAVAALLLAWPAASARAQQNEGPAAPAAAADEPAKAPAETKDGPPREIIVSLRQADRIPSDLRGAAAMFPIGRPAHGTQGCLYVPSYYHPARSWPLLVEGVQRGRLRAALRDFAAQAEKHGFIVLAVEYLFFQGEQQERKSVWTRQGEGTVQIQSRPMDEFLKDMVVDEKVLLDLLKQLQALYTVEKRAVGATGFLGAGLMAYRLPLVYPAIFCTGISRSGDFHEFYMPADLSRARDLPLFIVYGQMEESLTLDGSKAAIDFFKRRNFTNVQAERIPNSGVDSRPEIAANYFRGVTDAALGPEQAQFHRATNLACQVLGDRLPRDAVQATGRPIDGAAAVASLDAFVQNHPRSPFNTYCRFLAARLAAEKLNDPKRAEAALREFTSAPLLTDSLAPEAILYLVEKVIGPERDPLESRLLLRKVANRRDARPDVVARARRLSDEIAARQKQDKR